MVVAKFDLRIKVSRGWAGAGWWSNTTYKDLLTRIYIAYSTHVGTWTSDLSKILTHMFR